MSKKELYELIDRLNMLDQDWKTDLVPEDLALVQYAVQQAVAAKGLSFSLFNSGEEWTCKVAGHNLMTQNTHKNPEIAALSAWVNFLACPYCNGSGVSTTPIQKWSVWHGGWLHGNRVCSMCQGTGKREFVRC